MISMITIVYILQIITVSIVLFVLYNVIKKRFFEPQIITLTISEESAKIFRPGDHIRMGKKGYKIIDMTDNQIKAERVRKFF